MTKETKTTALQIGIGTCLYALAIVLMNRFDLDPNIEVGIFLLSYIMLSIEVIAKILNNIRKRHFLDENLLILIASMGGFLVGKYIEGVAVILFFQVGMLFESIAVGKARKSVADLIDIAPAFANRIKKGKEEQVEPNKLKPNDVIIIRPGERVPVDSIIILGSSTIDTKALTGESVPVDVSSGIKLLSGSVNLTGVLEARVEKIYEESTVAKILDLVDHIGEQKADGEKLVFRFSKIYTCLVVAAAIALMIIPGLTFAKGEWQIWVYRGLTFLIVACPCALVISVPLAFFGGIGAASKRGVLIKGSRYLEYLAKADTFVFDKTGTLTKGTFEIQSIVSNGITEEKLIEVAAYLESFSNHPIAVSLRDMYKKDISKNRIKKVKEFSGLGLEGRLDGQQVLAGNYKWMQEQMIECPDVRRQGTVIYVAMEKKYVGHIVVADVLREGAKEVIHRLQNYHQKITVMLTGDNEIVGKEVAEELGMDYVYAGLLPNEKVERLEEFLAVQGEDEKLVFIGDGINDAPVLARADVGIAMGALGSDAAIEAADVVLVNDDLSMILSVTKVAKETNRVVKQNVVVSIFVKLIVLALTPFGYMTMGDAIIIDIIIMIIATLNSVWILKYPE